MVAPVVNAVIARYAGGRPHCRGGQDDRSHGNSSGCSCCRCGCFPPLDRLTWCGGGGATTACPACPGPAAAPGARPRPRPARTAVCWRPAPPRCSRPPRCPPRLASPQQGGQPGTEDCCSCFTSSPTWRGHHGLLARRGLHYSAGVGWRLRCSAITLQFQHQP